MKNKIVQPSVFAGAGSWGCLVILWIKAILKMRYGDALPDLPVAMFGSDTVSATGKSAVTGNDGSVVSFDEREFWPPPSHPVNESRQVLLRHPHTAPIAERMNPDLDNETDHGAGKDKHNARATVAIYQAEYENIFKRLHDGIRDPERAARCRDRGFDPRLQQPTTTIVPICGSGGTGNGFCLDWSALIESAQMASGHHNSRRILIIGLPDSHGNELLNAANALATIDDVIETHVKRGQFISRGLAGRSVKLRSCAFNRILLVTPQSGQTVAGARSDVARKAAEIACAIALDDTARQIDALRQDAEFDVTRYEDVDVWGPRIFSSAGFGSLHRPGDLMMQNLANRSVEHITTLMRTG